jgi:hypothetical protein
MGKQLAEIPVSVLDLAALAEGDTPSGFSKRAWGFLLTKHHEVGVLHHQNLKRTTA